MFAREKGQPAQKTWEREVKKNGGTLLATGTVARLPITVSRVCICNLLVHFHTLAEFKRTLSFGFEFLALAPLAVNDSCE